MSWIGIGLLLVFAATTDTSSTTQVRLQATGRGAALAWDLSRQLSAGQITPEELVRQVTQLHATDRRQFLGAWEMARPDLPVALEIKEQVIASLGNEPATEPTPAATDPAPAEPKVTPEFTPLPDPTPEPYFVERPLSGRGPIAFALSFLLGMGIGHYVLGTYVHGLICAAVEIAGIAIMGASFPNRTGVLVGGSVLLVGWLSDWGGVVYYSYQTEDPVQVSRAVYDAELSEGLPVTDGGFRPTFTLFAGEF